MYKLNLILLFLLSFTFCNSQENLDIDFYDENEKNNVFAFVGELISIEEFDPNTPKEEKTEIDSLTGYITIHKNPIVMDRAFKLKYKVLKNLYNNLKTDTIEFLAYDHYGIPRFSEFKNVILYISKSQNGDYFFHQKYQYNEFYKSKNNEWVGLLNFGSVSRIESASKLNLKKIKLNKAANIDLKGYSKSDIELLYPKPFYKIKGDVAIPKLGISINDLIDYKVKSILENNSVLSKQ
jgi:hypothetical protein